MKTLEFHGMIRITVKNYEALISVKGKGVPFQMEHLKAKSSNELHSKIAKFIQKMEAAK
jgi:hypothetical protein